MIAKTLPGPVEVEGGGDGTYENVQTGHAEIHMLTRLPAAFTLDGNFDRRCAMRHLSERRLALPLRHTQCRQYVVAESHEHAEDPYGDKGVDVVDADVQVDLEVRDERDDHD